MTFAQTTDFLDALKPYGLQGIVIAFFMGWIVWTTRRETEREKTRAALEEIRERARDLREAKREESLLAVAKAMNHLTHGIALDVSTRPLIAQRTRDEVDQLKRAVTDQ